MPDEPQDWLDKVSVTITKTVAGVGSSSVLRSAFAASSFSMPPSSSRNTFRSDSRGLRVA